MDRLNRAAASSSDSFQHAIYPITACQIAAFADYLGWGRQEFGNPFQSGHVDVRKQWFLVSSLVPFSHGDACEVRRLPIGVLDCMLMMITPKLRYRHLID